MWNPLLSLTSPVPSGNTETTSLSPCVGSLSGQWERIAVPSPEVCVMITWSPASKALSTLSSQKDTAHAGCCLHQSVAVRLHIWAGHPHHSYFAVRVSFLIYPPSIIDSLFSFQKHTNKRVPRILIILLNLQINLRRVVS